MKPLQYLGHRFNDPLLWVVNRNSVSRGAAIGLFCAYLPMPFEMLPAALLAIFWRANLPLSILLVWLSNPFTWLVLYIPPYLLGSALLGDTTVAIDSITVEVMLEQLAALWLGCLIFGVALGTGAYFTTRVIWRMWTLNDWDKRRQERVGNRRKRGQK